MKKHNLLLLPLFALLFTASCSKDDDNGEPAEITPEGILYDLNDIVLNPIESTVSLDAGCDVPFPNDSIQLVNIDIDNDGVEDYEIKYANWYEEIPVHDVCLFHNTYVEIKALDKGALVTCEETNGIIAYLLDEDEKIDSKLKYSYRGLFHIDAPSSEMYNPYTSGKKILGLKLASGKLGLINFEFNPATYKFTIKSWAHQTNDADYIDNSVDFEVIVE